jgi:hypothetical protein
MVYSRATVFLLVLFGAAGSAFSDPVDKNDPIAKYGYYNPANKYRYAQDYVMTPEEQATIECNNEMRGPIRVEYWVYERCRLDKIAKMAEAAKPAKTKRK